MKFFIVCCILVSWVAAVAATAASPSSAPSPAPALAPETSDPFEDCSTLVFNMIDCLTYIEKGSNETKPDESCCSGFKSVVKGNAGCICVALSSSESLGIHIDVSRAKKLSSMCHVSPNPVDTCKAKPSPSEGTPSKSPYPPHAAKPPASPKTHPKAPAPAPGSSGAHAISAAPSFILITLLGLSFCHILA